MAPRIASGRTPTKNMGSLLHADMGFHFNAD